MLCVLRLRKQSGFGFGIPVVVAAEEGCGWILFRFGWGALVGPGEVGGGEDRAGVAEDELDGALAVGLGVVLAGVVGEEGVLMTEEAAVFEDAAVGPVGCGDCLAAVACGVFEGDVVGLEAGAVDLYGFGEEGASGLLGV